MLILYILSAPEDEATYGSFKDYGYWGGGSWGGIIHNPRGFWVYVSPYWLVFKTQN